MISMSANAGKLEAALAVIAERWPDVARAIASAPEPAQLIARTDTPAFTLWIDGIHLSSVVDPEAEAMMQAEQIPESAPEVHLYGIGSGALARTLLTRPALRQLHATIMNPGVLRCCLAHFDFDWLRDPRVMLALPANQDRVQWPFAASPACLRLADESAARLRDQVQLELNTPYIRANFRERARELARQVQANHAHLAVDGDVARLFGSQPGSTVLVAAAGPTLADHYDWLREHRDLPLIAVDAALRPLLDAGITPTVVVCIDGSRDGILPYFDGNLGALTEVPLVYFPAVHPDVLERWPGPRLAAYSDHELYHEAMKRWPKGTLFASGTVTHAAVDLAVRMGARDVHLLGTDFCFARGRTHVDGSAQAADAPQTAGSPWVLNRRGERVATLGNLRAYLRDLEGYIACHPEVRFHVHGEGGAAIAGTRLWEER